VAAASVLAKVERDARMVALHERHPRYGWAENKGYASPDHLAALASDGPCELHRRSWRLPPYGSDDDPDGDLVAEQDDELDAFEQDVTAAVRPGGPPDRAVHDDGAMTQGAR
jgi:ribonuclease HII